MNPRRRARRRRQRKACRHLPDTFRRLDEQLDRCLVALGRLISVLEGNPVD